MSSSNMGSRISDGSPEATPTDGRITRLLHAASEGDALASAELITLVYKELRRRAANYMRVERPSHTLQPTALVHEAYLKLVGQNANWKNRWHFLGVASQLMRRILVDHARKRGAEKRPADQNKVSFQDALVAAVQRPSELIALDEALEKLEGEHPRHARVIELRYFGGSTVDETAEILKISPETVNRDWAFAKTWLRREMHTEK